jgi:23S rRNA pseudouridine2604 synthase
MNAPATENADPPSDPPSDPSHDRASDPASDPPHDPPHDPASDTTADPGTGERLAKRLARQLSCSRSEAEQYIAGGFVTVDGTVVEAPQFRVLDEAAVALDPKARLGALVPVTLLAHKPAGVEATSDGLLDPGNRFATDRSDIRPLKRHLQQQACVTPLETSASGLVVFTQDPRIRRKLLEEAALVENETMVDVSGEVTPQALAQLNAGQVVGGRAMLAAKVSISRQADGRRAAFRHQGYRPGGRPDVRGCRPALAVRRIWPGACCWRRCRLANGATLAANDSNLWRQA